VIDIMWGCRLPLAFCSNLGFSQQPCIVLEAGRPSLILAVEAW